MGLQEDRFATDNVPGLFERRDGVLLRAGKFVTDPHDSNQKPHAKSHPTVTPPGRRIHTS